MKTKQIIKIILAIMIGIIMSSCDNSTKFIPTRDITLNFTSVEIGVNEEIQLQVTISPDNATNQTVTWQSSNEEVATVTQDGVVTTLTVGIASISVSTEDDLFTATCDIYVAEHFFTVANEEQWNQAINTIKNNGNDKSYIINVIDDFSVQGSGDPHDTDSPFPDFPYPGILELTFGDVTGVTVHINGNHTIKLSSEGSILNITENQEIIVHDIIFEGIEDNYHFLFYVLGYGAKFTMAGKATIQNNFFGIYLQHDANFFMQDNSKIEYIEKAAVRMYNGSYFHMSGGTIQNNDADDFFFDGYSAIIMVWNSTFLMTDGVITNNARSFAAVNVRENSFFTMHGGFIHDNIDGFNVCVWNNSTFNFYDGTISGVRERSQGVRVSSNSIFNMYGGSITGHRGCAVSLIYDVTFSMYGGEIYNNHSPSSLPGGVFICDSSSLFMYSGIIYGSVENGVPVELANSSRLGGASISGYPPSVVKYGDGTDIELMERDGIGRGLHSDETIIGRR